MHPRSGQTEPQVYPSFQLALSGVLANPFGQGLRFVEPTYATGPEDPASRDSTAQSMSFHSGARDSNTLPK